MYGKLIVDMLVPVWRWRYAVLTGALVCSGRRGNWVSHGQGRCHVVGRKGVGHHYTGYWVHTLEPWAEDTGMGNGPRSFLDLGGGMKKHEWV